MAPFPARQRLAASVCLLHSLTQLPVLPARDPVPPDNSSSSVRRTLSAARERQLSKDFAFLAAHSNDARTVKAVALEEHGEAGGLTVRVAANTGSLDKAKLGLQKIGTLLEEAAREQQLANARMRVCKDQPSLDSEKKQIKNLLQDIEAQIAHQVVVLDWARIVSRLKSICLPTGRHRTKKVILKVIKTLKAAATASTSSPTPSPANKKKKEELRDLGREHASQFLNANKDLSVNEPADIKKLSEVVSEFDDWKALLKFDDSNLDLSARMQLDHMRKLGHYKVVCRSLVAAATKYTKLFEKVLVESVDFPVIDDNYPEGGLLPFDNVFDKKRYPDILPTEVSQLKAKYERKANLWRLQTGYKVHAEVQLLLYYETNPPAIWPRYLSSNKKACYLCQLLISRHGGFRVPSSHGRLYPQWALPDLAPHLQKRLERVMQSVISTVENDVDTCRQRRQNHPFPIESEFSLPLTASEVSSVKLQIRVRDATAANVQQPQAQIDQALHAKEDKTSRANQPETKHQTKKPVPAQKPIPNGVEKPPTPVVSIAKPNPVKTNEEVYTPVVNSNEAQKKETSIENVKALHRDKETPIEDVEALNGDKETPIEDVEALNRDKTIRQEGDLRTATEPATLATSSAPIETSSKIPSKPVDENDVKGPPSNHDNEDRNHKTCSPRFEASETWSCQRVSPRSPCLVGIGEDNLHVHMDSSPKAFGPSERYWIGFQKLSIEKAMQWRSSGGEPVDVRRLGFDHKKVVIPGGGIESNNPLFLRSGSDSYMFQYAHGPSPPLEPILPTS